MDGFDENKATKMMDLYSRQIGTFGVDTMKNMITLSVLIVGLKGVGVETAKNLILAGPKAVTIVDNEPVEIADLGTNFFLSDKVIGEKRGKACLSLLSVLNPYVDVSVYEQDITEEFLSKFGAVVVTDNTPLETLKKWSAFCHKNNILFLLATARGVTCSIFADFGSDHKVTDPNGEPQRVNVVENIVTKKNDEGKFDVIVRVAADSHGLDDGQEVKFEEVEGLNALNKFESIPIKRVYHKVHNDDPKKVRHKLVPTEFKVVLDEIDGQWTRGGIVTEIKQPQSLSFRALEEAIVNPLTENDFIGVPHPENEKLFSGRGTQLHFAQQAFWAFQEKHKRIPGLHSLEDANECVELAKEFLVKSKGIADAYNKIEDEKEAAHNKKEEEREKEHNKAQEQLPEDKRVSFEKEVYHRGRTPAVTVESIDEKIVRDYALYSKCELPGITAFLGGVAAQEIVKKFGKFTPLRQWLYLDYFELLKDTVPDDAKPLNTRYDHQIAIFGKAFQDKLADQKWFMVGCGALGCEYLKGFALMGLGSGSGVVYVTDMDTIEVSNLNRQFLFRKENVQQPKSVCASNRALEMNPDMNIKTFEIPVGPKTENVFNDAFWSSLDGVCNALDNVEARKYTDSKIVFFEKPLLESGTLGTKANSEIVIPHQTKSYSEFKDAEEEDTIPMCTLRNFPHLIEHCIEWSRAQFTEIFEDPPKDLNTFIEDKKSFFEKVEKEGNTSVQLSKLKEVQDMMGIVKEWNFEACVKASFDEFMKQFRDRIMNLTHAFPRDLKKKDKISGEEVAFWSGSKRFPRAAEFDLNNSLHFDYLYTCSNLFAFMLGIPFVRDRDEFKKIVEKLNLKPKEWTPNKKAAKALEAEVKAEEEGRTEERDIEEDDDEKEIENIKKSLSEVKANGKKLEPADFEKDDDTNFHIDFITACSNLRAWNYYIRLASRHQCKMIAGKIMPAVATTTAMVTGLVEIELYKLILGLEKKKFVCANVNLGTSTYQLFEPDKPSEAEEKYDPLEMEVVKPVPEGFTTWSKVIIDKGDLTVDEFVKVFGEVHHGCTVESLFKRGIDDDDVEERAVTPIYVSFAATNNQKEMMKKNRPRKLTEVYEELYGKIEENRNYLLLDGSHEKDDKPVKVPLIKYIFKH